ncbi:MAG: ferrochelatase [Myxococcales bacterium FL481]|nr:MAG: ferrochelatase [Myxococcales bacterium FL481]
MTGPTIRASWSGVRFATGCGSGPRCSPRSTPRISRSEPARLACRCWTILGRVDAYRGPNIWTRHGQAAYPMLQPMHDSPSRVGVLLVDVGTPASPRTGDVRRFLREFLDDRRMLDMPTWARKLLVYGVILPFRPRKSAAAYRKIWLPDGSPLSVYGNRLAAAVGERLGERFVVRFGVTSGGPSIDDVLEELHTSDVGHIVVVPLLPPHASTGRGIALERVYRSAGARWRAPSLTVVPPFYDAQGYIDALARVASPVLEPFAADHLLVSFHGVPERDVTRSVGASPRCLQRQDCCDAIDAENRGCYRAQCFATARAFAGAVGYRDRYTVSFQSRLGRAKWIDPDTTVVMPQLAKQGVRRLAVACPNFLLDCLETLEEIGIRGKQQWDECGGEGFVLIPCLNADPSWADVIAQWAREHARVAEMTGSGVSAASVGSAPSAPRSIG